MATTLSRCCNCFEDALVETLVGRELVMQCDHCHGVWFEDGALNRAIAQKHDHLDQYQHEPFLGDKLGHGGRLCRRCDVNMQRYHLLQHYEVEVDCCPSCDGVWLDRGEIDQVMHSPLILQSLSSLNEIPGWRSWVFQFFTRMPIEFNLKPHRIPWMTYGIIFLCSVLFVASQLSSEFAAWQYHFLGFNTDASSSWLLASQLISHQFVHGGWMHLLGNLYFLWLVGDNIEDVLGHGRYFGLYLGCGLLAALTEWLFFDASQGPLLLVGASGSIAALFGIYLVWFRYASLTMMFGIFQVKLAPFWYFLIWSLFNVFGLWMGESGVAYWAHLGGFVAGIAIGYALYDWVRARNPLIELLNQPEVKVNRPKPFSSRK